MKYLYNSTEACNLESFLTLKIFIYLVNVKKTLVHSNIILGVQLCFRRFPIDGFSGKWWSK